MWDRATEKEFHRILEECLSRQGWVMPREAAEWAVRILVAHLDRVPWQPEPSYAEAYMTAHKPESLLELGNTCWFTRAVFPELGQRRGICSSYYVDLGTSCYHRVLAQWPNPVLAEFNRHFEFIAEIVYTAIHTKGDFRSMWD